MSSLPLTASFYSLTLDWSALLCLVNFAGDIISNDRTGETAKRSPRKLFRFFVIRSCGETRRHVQWNSKLFERAVGYTARLWTGEFAFGILKYNAQLGRLREGSERVLNNKKDFWSGKKWWQGLNILLYWRPILRATMEKEGKRNSDVECEEWYSESLCSYFYYTSAYIRTYYTFPGRTFVTFLEIPLRI